MKRLVAPLAALLLFTLLCACAPAPAEPAASPLPAACSPEPDASREALCTILADMQQNYHPGTAGCSLTAARLAGALLDWNAGAGWDPAAVTAGVKTFYEGLDAGAAADFAGAQLPGIYDGAQALLSDTARDLLESAGYAPASFPWAAEAVKSLFSAVYAGVGAALPE